MANQFFGFSPEAFEQFVRALALSVFGPGVTTFGNGPDGGREATFRGEVPFPYPPATQWSGYGVIQAKCKEKPDSSEKETKWALQQLDNELKTFVKSKKRDPKPEFYVYATNVELSSAAGGGKDQCNKLIESYNVKLPIKGHAIWDANQLNGFLAANESLRKRFISYLTPDDILAAMLADIERRRPNINLILTSFLERELRADEVSRLEQAGNRTEEQLRLARLFFDLPVSTEPQLVPPDDEPTADGNLPPGVLWELLQAGSRKLDPKTLYEQETASFEGTQEQFPTRFVLLGGPGSGKSTVCQFLAQIHRSALLGRREAHLLEPQTRKIIEETRQLCNREGLSWPATPRYPLRVELNRFARALASKDEDHVQSLERYLLNGIKRDHKMNNEDLIEWLATYPSLLILDGLDEVPATSNRDELVKSVNDFLAQARQVGADLFVVATSRQQGYAGEFASGFVAFRHVLPLSTIRALKYVERYADARFGTSDPNRSKDIVDKLRQSSKRDLTAQLMSSPLQVTFMVTVVAAKGDPGEDRWQLFDSYYRTIYDRERQKAVPPYDAVLSKQQPTIDRLHHDIGFWLQYRGETEGGTAVSLPIVQFERLVDTYLSEIGREGSEKEQKVKLITDAARHRLVFLTSRVEGELCFDVRSLQEYMAAECLMTGNPDVVISRLRAIASVPYWRNVFLFSASKCFADARSRHLHDAIRLLCEDLNSPSDGLLEATKAGSELAIDVLQSGAVAENPNYARHLARIGLALISEPYMVGKSKEGASADQRLAIVYNHDLESIYRNELELRIGQTEVNRTFGAWLLLFRLINRDIDWAIPLAEKYWHCDMDQLIKFQLNFPEMFKTVWLRGKLTETLSKKSPSKCGVFLYRCRDIYDVSDPLSALCRLIDGQEKMYSSLNIFSQDSKDNLSLTFTTTRGGNTYYGLLEMFPRNHPGWLPFILVNKFYKLPGNTTLATILKECADGGWESSDKALLGILPWPLSSCLQIVQSTEDLLDLAQLIENGALGSIEDWIAAEERWQSEGINIDDILQQSDSSLPFGSAISKIGLPASYSQSITQKVYPDSTIKTLITTSQKVMSDREQQMLFWFLCLASKNSAGSIVKHISPSNFRILCEKIPSSIWWSHSCIACPKDPKLQDKWVSFFDWLGRSEKLGQYYPPHESDFADNDPGWCEIFQQAFIRSREQNGLIRHLARLAADGRVITLIPLEFLYLQSFSDSRDQLAAALIRLTQPDLTSTEAISLADAVSILLEIPPEPCSGKLVFRTCEMHLDRVPTIGQFLLRLHGRIPANVDLGVANCERLLRNVLRRRASDLHLIGRIEEMQLPSLPHTN